jgi:hypothetical protein
MLTLAFGACKSVLRLVRASTAPRGAEGEGIGSSMGRGEKRMGWHPYKERQMMALRKLFSWGR